jgi:NSS family neurotransmitter:Na+ symporter
MTEERRSIHGQWSTRMAFILAATGSAVGLGNIWKFPYITGENGGGAFVLVYLFCIFLIGIPVMMAEILLGRRGRQSPINTMRTLATEENLTAFWKYLGWMGVLAGFLILSYYSVIAGWALAYIFRSASGMFTGATAVEAQNIFSELIADPERLLAWHTIFIIMTTIVVARGVRSGLEKAVRYLMPLLIAILLLLLGYAMSEGAFQQGLHFLFDPDFSKLTGTAILTAMGHSFFTLSLGMGAIMVYGSYLPKKTSITKVTIIVAMADTAVALIAGMAIFPIVFANGLEPAAGPGLIFQTLPIAFGQMPGGDFFGPLFFVLLVFAAWTSAISLIEPAVAWLVENHGQTRIYASVVVGMVTWFMGLVTVFSFNIWADFKIWGLTPFDILDKLTSNIMLPLGGLLIAVFAGWLMSRQSVHDELAMKYDGAFKLWYHILLRFIAPLGVIIVFLHAIGVLE